jgi:hypothetical protein
MYDAPVIATACLPHRLSVPTPEPPFGRLASKVQAIEPDGPRRRSQGFGYRAMLALRPWLLFANLRLGEKGQGPFP